MARATARIGLIQVVIGLGMIAVLARAAQLQLVEGAEWRARAEAARQERKVLVARRGGIYDRNGVPLAITQEYFHIGIAPNELLEPGDDARTIARALGMPLGQVQRDLRKKWVQYQGPFSGLQVRPLRPIRGVHLTSDFARHSPSGGLASAVIGTLKPDSANGASGIELALDDVLTGTPGFAILLKDRAGRRYDSPSRQQRNPVPGKDVFLTIDAELQEIAERALDEAMTRYEAKGGDIVILDPHSGELLALASRVTDNGKLVSTRPTFFTTPFEPGSTAKLFTAAALLMRDRVKPTDAVHVTDGRMVIQLNSRGATRPITDAHKTNGDITLAHAIKISSNVAMAMFSSRLSNVEQFESLRDFGFGAPTGVEYPSEARGGLRFPDQWAIDSRASIAMGYEFQVTPVQLATAYAAIANDGILLTPTLIKEVRGPEGQTEYSHQPEPVRRAVSPEVAHTLREYLKSVLEEGGTAEGARLANYSLAGKTGTAVKSLGKAGYAKDRYTASFAALFPADDPQLVVVVKIDDPAGAHFGGETAAPVTRGMLEEALAARQSAIDRLRLVEEGGTTEGVAAGAPQPVEREEPPEQRATIVLPVASVTPARERTLVPGVAGGSVRRAANALHRRGFRVAVYGHGKVLRTTPAAGDSAQVGSLVSVWAE
ncbi:MAG: penicillin-binding transpeptidase domain-containing protein [Gemmatimonadales bacterium]